MRALSPHVGARAELEGRRVTIWRARVEDGRFVPVEVQPEGRRRMTYDEFLRGAALTVWWHAVVESLHELQNPTSPEKILLLGERLGLGPGSRVLDVAGGRGGPAILLAGGLRLPDHVRRAIAGVRRHGPRARRRRRASRSWSRSSRPTPRPTSPRAASTPPSASARRSSTAVSCRRSSGSRGRAARRRRRAYWRTWPLPPEAEPDDDEDWLPLAATVHRA